MSAFLEVPKVIIFLIFFSRQFRSRIGWSALTIRVPFFLKPSVIETFSFMIASIEPKPVRWARWTLLMRTISGQAIFDRPEISPGWLLPISATIILVSGCADRMVIGRPILLLKLFGDWTALKCLLRQLDMICLVVVLPTEPVIPITMGLSRFDNNGQFCRKPLSCWEL